ncbi:FadR/GntR family transcriptional regulator [Rhodococcus qingshengii]|uniref:FadR/GntR family transcriptional regulator n=2 Tax=Rhodococcus qingshengii TaxID=334542 RepID=A0AAW6LVI3_RHOSG|nr:FadR/GntR family transcriptional regulator [Rhodococcus qingshengii]MDE8649903.1 FadR/GntR family transcriptional regulator [Rhodococcus qingshengii]
MSPSPNRSAIKPVGADRRNAAEAVLADLQQLIADGELHVGARLPSEVALCERYAVSRTVVREALRSTGTLGLTETRSGSGTFVIARLPRPSLSYGAYTARDLLEARPAVEVPAAGLAAERRSQEQLDSLADLCRRMDLERDSAKWVTLDTLFHCEIAEASGNAVFKNVVIDTREALVRQSRVLNSVVRPSVRMLASNYEHRMILNALAAGSPMDAKQSMQAHLDRVSEIVTAFVDNDEPA